MLFHVGGSGLTAGLRYGSRWSAEFTGTLTPLPATSRSYQALYFFIDQVGPGYDKVVTGWHTTKSYIPQLWHIGERRCQRMKTTIMTQICHVVPTMYLPTPFIS